MNTEAVEKLRKAVYAEAIQDAIERVIQVRSTATYIEELSIRDFILGLEKLKEEKL
jgi:hypothetical protein